jgi:hypothetical protein
MDTSGSAREGWMAIIPGTVFVLFVVIALGGPVQFMNFIVDWGQDLLGAVMSWLKNL